MEDWAVVNKPDNNQDIEISLPYTGRVLLCIEYELFNKTFSIEIHGKGIIFKSGILIKKNH